MKTISILITGEVPDDAPLDPARCYAVVVLPDPHGFVENPAIKLMRVAEPPEHPESGIYPVKHVHGRDCPCNAADSCRAH